MYSLICFESNRNISHRVIDLTRNSDSGRCCFTVILTLVGLLGGGGRTTIRRLNRKRCISVKHKSRIWFVTNGCCKHRDIIIYRYILSEDHLLMLIDSVGLHLIDWKPFWQIGSWRFVDLLCQLIYTALIYLLICI